MNAPIPPNLYKQLLKALAAGQVNRVERLLTDGDGQGTSAWTATLATPLKGEMSLGAPPSPIELQNRRRQEHGSVAWETTRRAPVKKRVRLYALLDRYDIPVERDQAMSLLWRDGDGPGLRAYWHQRGIHLRDHRDRLIRVMCTWHPNGYLPPQSDVDFTGVPLSQALPQWAREDPELFETSEQRGQMARVLSHRHAHVRRIAELLDAWEGQSLDLCAQTSATPIPIGDHLFEVPAGNVLTDLVAQYMRFLDERVVRWSQPEAKGPSVHFWDGLTRFETTYQRLVAKGADPHARNAQGLTSQDLLSQGPGGDFLRSLARQRQLQARESVVSPAGTTSRRRI